MLRDGKSCQSSFDSCVEKGADVIIITEVCNILQYNFCAIVCIIIRPEKCYHFEYHTISFLIISQNTVVKPLKEKWFLTIVIVIIFSFAGNIFIGLF